MNTYFIRETDYLEHSALGTSWGKHKYIRIENGRYIYPEDLQKAAANGSKMVRSAVSNGTGMARSAVATGKRAIANASALGGRYAIKARKTAADYASKLNKYARSAVSKGRKMLNAKDLKRNLYNAAGGKYKEEARLHAKAQRKYENEAKYGKLERAMVKTQYDRQIAAGKAAERNGHTKAARMRYGLAESTANMYRNTNRMRQDQIKRANRSAAYEKDMKRAASDRYADSIAGRIDAYKTAKKKRKKGVRTSAYNERMKKKGYKNLGGGTYYRFN